MVSNPVKARGQVSLVKLYDGTNGKDGKDGAQGVPGAPGADGKTTYVHVAYADSADGKTNFSTTDPTNRKYIGVLTDFNINDATDYTLYTWSLAQGPVGPTGSTGATGPKGADGLTTYVHVAYANSADGKTDFSTTDPVGKAYIGVLTDTVPADSTDYTKYTWSLVKGSDGAQGPQGVQGPKGTDGKTTYAHFAYANSADGSKDFSTTDTTGRNYIGVFTDTNINDSTNYADYTWSLVQGPTGPTGNTGAVGPKGADGRTTYVHVAYADSVDGLTNFSTTDATGRKYIGVLTDFNMNDSTTPGDYTWSLAQGPAGPTGSTGATGAKGADGRTTYVHVAYANSADGATSFSTTDPTNRAYIGVLTDFNINDSTNYADYTWSLAKGADGAQGPQGVQGIAGAKGADGKTTYVHVAYANSANGSVNFSTTDPTNRAYIGVLTDFDINDSVNYADYTWSLAKGADGSQGPQGPQGLTGAKGIDGKTTYVHVAYANSADGATSFSTTDPTGRAYIGVLTDFNINDSTNYSDYTWSLAKGADGANGAQGVQGPKGADGRTTYVHFSYANSADGKDGFSVSDPVGKAYMGTYTDFTLNDSTNYLDYTWSLVKGADGAQGAQGIQGPNGADGRTTYVHFAYANSADGTTNFSVSDPTGRAYIGTYTDFTINDSTTPSAYIWSLIKGADGANGAQGIQGPKGADGRTTYVHFAYANSADGTNNFSVSDPTGRTYIGTYTDFTLNDSTTPSAYTWSLIKGSDGAQGAQGIQGPKGADGKNTYVHFAYAGNATGTTNFSTTDPTGRAYIGVLTDFNINDSTNYADYTWSLAQGPTGPTGANGATGPKGADGKTTYVHISYASNATGTSNFSTTDPTGRTYIGVLTDTNLPDSTNPADYSWSLIKGADGAQGPQGIQGPVGANGKNTYVHFAYANSANGATSFSTTDPTGRAYIGVLTDFNLNDSTNYADYTWSLAKGADGAQGIQGPKGVDGRTPYFHIAYADSANGDNNFSTTDTTGRAYIGVLTDFNINDSTTPSDYTWSLAKGADGANGAQGIQGPVGPDGRTSYVHFAYANSADGSDRFTTVYPNLNLLTGTSGPFVMGFGIPNTTWDATNKVSGISLPVTVKQGEVLPQGTGFSYKYVPGVTYTQSVYISTDAPLTGTSIKFTWYTPEYGHNTGGTDSLVKVSTNVYRATSTYMWPSSKVVPAYSRSADIMNLTQVFDFTKGTFLQFYKPKLETGSTATPYMPSSSEVTTADYPSYIGQYTDFTLNDSTTPSTYKWSLAKGADGANGAQGVPGAPGADGKTTYVHFAYANSADGAVGFDVSDPTGRTYIGTYTDFTINDSTNYKSYTWSRMKGDTGNGIANTVIEYQITNTQDQPSDTSGWTTTIPNIGAGVYLWTRTTFVYTDGTKSRTYTVSRQSDNVYTAVLTNDSITLPADASGNVTDFSGSNGQFLVYDGAYQVDPTKVTIQVAQQVNVTVATGGSNYSITAMDKTKDSGYFDLSYTYKGVLLTKRVSVSKSKRGTDGSNPVIVNLSATSQVFTFDSNNKPYPTNQNINFSTTVSGTSATPVYTAIPYTDTGAAGTAIVLGAYGTNGKQLQVAQIGNYQRVVVTVTAGGGTDSTTIVRVKDGSSVSPIPDPSNTVSSATPPTNPKEGDWWNDTSQTPNVLKYRYRDKWVQYELDGYYVKANSISGEAIVTNTLEAQKIKYTNSDGTTTNLQTFDLKGIQTALTDSSGHTYTSMDNAVSSTQSFQSFSNKVNNLQVGGRNLYITATQVAGYVTGDDGRIFGQTTFKEMSSDYIAVSPNTTYTFQAWGSLLSGQQYWSVVGQYGSDKSFISRLGGLYGASPATTDVPNDYEERTFTTSTNTYFVRVSSRTFGNYRVKFERGNMPTDWTPAPEDTDSVITKAQADIQTNATAITQKVSQSDYNSNNQVIGGQISQLQQRADGFDATVTKVNNMQVGGRNYVLNSSGLNGSSTVRPTLKGSLSGANVLITYPVDGILITNGATNTTTEWYYQVVNSWTPFSNTPLTPGNAFSFSADVMGTVPQVAMRWGFNGGTGGYESYKAFNINNTSWTRVSVTMASNATNTGLYFRIQGAINNQYKTGWSGGETLKFRNVKIEDGNMPSPWTPAPEDVDSATAKAQLTADNATLSINNYKTSNDGRVSQAEANIMANANAITTKVSQSDYNSNNQVIGGQISQLQQRADGFDLTVTKVNGLSVGGRNVLLNTASRTAVGPNATNSTPAAFRWALANNATVGSLYTSWGNNAPISISFDWSITGSTIAGSFNPQWNSAPWGVGTSGATGVTVSSSNTSGHYKWSSTTQSGWSGSTANQLHLRTDSLQGTLTITNLKFEQGNMPTAWSPAPEDTSSAISTVQAQVNNLGQVNKAFNTEFIPDFAGWTTSPYMSIDGSQSGGPAVKFSRSDLTGTNASWQNIRQIDSLAVSVKPGDLVSASLFVINTPVTGTIPTADLILMTIEFTDSNNGTVLNSAKSIANLSNTTVTYNGVVTPAGATAARLKIETDGNAVFSFRSPMLVIGPSVGNYTPGLYNNNQAIAQAQSTATNLSLKVDSFTLGTTSDGHLVSGFTGNQQQVTLKGNVINLDSETVIADNFVTRILSTQDATIGNSLTIRTGGQFNTDILHMDKTIFKLNAPSTNSTRTSAEGFKVTTWGSFKLDSTLGSISTDGLIIIAPPNQSTYQAVFHSEYNPNNLFLSATAFQNQQPDEFLDMSASELVFMKGGSGFISGSTSYTTVNSSSVTTPTLNISANHVTSTRGDLLLNSATNSVIMQGGGLNMFQARENGYPYLLNAKYGSGGSSLQIFGDGALVGLSSSIKYKTNVVYEYGTEAADKLMTLSPATWQDKWDDEQIARYNETGQYPDRQIDMSNRRYYGMIAEDMIKAGLDEFVLRNETTGELMGIQYEKIGIALIPAIRELRKKVNEQTVEIERLKETGK